LQLVFFDQEEQNLQGSLAFTLDPLNLDHLLGVIVLDMVGYRCDQPGCQAYPRGLPIAPPSDRGDFLAVVGTLEHPNLLNAFKASPLTYTLPVPFKGLLTPDVLRSDHAPFWFYGIDAVLVTDTGNLRNPHYHRPSDRSGTIDPVFFAEAAQTVVDALLALQF
jgi:Zn-dependent M28 family amino/carboxypeptidase